MKERSQIELDKLRDQIEELALNPPIQNPENDAEIESMNSKLTDLIEKYKYSEAEKGTFLLKTELFLYD